MQTIYQLYIKQNFINHIYIYVCTYRDTSYIYMYTYIYLNPRYINHIPFGHPSPRLRALRHGHADGAGRHHLPQLRPAQRCGDPGQRTTKKHPGNLVVGKISGFYMFLMVLMMCFTWKNWTYPTWGGFYVMISEVWEGKKLFLKCSK